MCITEPSAFPSNTFAHAGFIDLNLRTLNLRVKNFWLLLFLLVSFPGLTTKSKQSCKMHVMLK